MGRCRCWRVPALLVVLSLLLAACSKGDDTSPSTTTTTAAKAKFVKIGLIAPTSGNFASLGTGIRNGAELAVKEANASSKVRGWKVELVVKDDIGDPEMGATAATALADDPLVFGVVGTLNQSVAARVQPILGAKNIVMVSPSSAGLALTRGTDARSPQRPFANYFSVATTDDAQGPFAADFAKKDLNVKTVVTISDGKTYGRGLVEGFTSRITANGATIAAAEVVDPGATDFTALLARIKPLNPDLLFYGGEYPQAQLLTKQAKDEGFRIPFMGGDGIYDSTYIKEAKESAEGDLAVSVGSTDDIASANEFVDAYDAAGFKEPYGTYGAYAYDATNAIIAALSKTLANKTDLDAGLRPAVVTAVQATNLEGATGPVSFNEFGETNNRVLTVFRVTNQEWTAVKTDRLG
jgi:branched-chain amino acid transport system substrate-binding protein